jgi:hypothetical protein
MAIATNAQLQTGFAKGQVVYLDKGSVAGTTFLWNTNFASAIGGSGAGTLAGTSTTQGVVPTSATAGFPYIRPIAAGNTAYLGAVDFNTGMQTAGRIRLFDMLFKAGAYNFNDSGITLSAQPSFASRLPGGDYVGTELWFEAVTAFATAAPTITVTYTNQDGLAGQSTGAFVVAAAAPAVARMVQIPLAPGDSGIQKIESVTSTGPTAGTFNLLIVRPLWTGRVKQAQDYGPGYTHGPDKTSLPIVYDTSALFTAVATDLNANTGAISLALSIVEG